MFETQRLACGIVAAVQAGQALDAALAAAWSRHPRLTAQQRAAVMDLSYGTLRFGMQLEAVAEQLLHAPLRDPALRRLLLVALYQLAHTHAAPYAVVDHAVRCAGALGAARAGGLINAVLRNFLRRKAAVFAAALQADSARYSYPRWWAEKIRSQYPMQFAAVLESGNQHPPLTLRVNRRQIARDEYLALLERESIKAHAVGEDAVTLARPLPVNRIPGFCAGLVSVQDAAAQLAAPLLDARDGMRVLDACAAPGGKSGHLLERADLDLTALDISPARLDRVRDNLGRLGLHATLVAGDAGDAPGWWDGQPFDRILADAPCSASGVVRRHPDIKWLRRASDIPKFVEQQSLLLDGLWQLLARGGKFLYATCSVFMEENSQQVAHFLARHADAGQLPLCGAKTLNGRLDGQLLPDSEHDGFFYALFIKA